MHPLITFILTIATTFSSSASDWPHFRGAHHNGSTEETNLPSEWSLTRNIAWSVDLPGAGAATPVIWKNRVFISTTDEEKQTLKALCFDRLTGNLLWQHTISTEIRQDSRSNFASPTPTTDGKVVVFFYGNGDMAACDLAGDKLWYRNIQRDFGSFAFNWTFSTSPLLFEGRLYLQVLQRDVSVGGRGWEDRMNHSYLLALNPRTGEKLWQHIRTSQARQESRESFATPVPFKYQGRWELLVVGGDDLTGHDPKTGNELWRWGTWNPTRITNWRHVTSPVAGKSVILVCAPKRDPIYAIKAGGIGILGRDAVAWESSRTKELSADVPTPAFYDGDFFVLSDVRKRLCRVDSATGKAKWTFPTPGTHKFEASPLAADGKIYLINFAGSVVVVDAEHGQQINHISMDQPSDDPVRSSIVAAYGNLFIRTNRKLYCIGPKPVDSSNF